jgi:tripartite-type tricarboxylate transporter receptor subunit TctC
VKAFARARRILGVEIFILHPSSFILTAAIALTSSIAHAQPYPAKPIRVIVPFTPGTGMDILARSAGQKLSERWGQGVVIDNRPGAGTPQHMAGELFKLITGIQMVHVPYKGSAGAVTDLVGGQVPVMFMPLHTALPHAQAGRLRVLAQSGAQRSLVGPDFPTFDEAGVRGVDVDFWYGMLAPANLPRDLVMKLNTEVAAVLRLTDVRDSLRRQGLEPVTGTPEQFAQLIRADLAKWARVVKDARIAAD